jgi:hypothetical protein
MNTQDLRGFFSLLAEVADLHGKTLSEGQLQIYAIALQPYDAAAVNHALQRAIVELKWFPKPAELVEIIEGSREDRAESAWDAAWDAYLKAGYYESVLFQDGAIARAILTVFGGWVQFSAASRELDQKSLQFKRLEFIAAYRRETRRGKEPMRLPGHYEIENQNTVATWNRDKFSDTYTQRLYVVRAEGGRFVDAHFSRSDARMIESDVQLLSAAQVPALPARPQLQLAPPPSERARQMTPEEIKGGIRSLIKSVKSNRV